jgi:sugar (pentulose or hexulose) kinase
MHFMGFEIGHGGNRAVVLGLESAVIRAGAWVPYDWIEVLPAGYREQNPAQWIDSVDRAVRQMYQELMSRQQYLVDTLHSAAFLQSN